MYSNARLKSLEYIHAMIIERRITYGTPHDPSQWTNTTIGGAIFGRYFSLSGGSVWSNFGTNGQDALVFLSSKALK